MTLAWMRLPRVLPLIAMIALVAIVAVACSDDDDPTSTPSPTGTETTTATATGTAEPTATEEEVGGTITLYSGRSESLVAPIIEQFQQATGISVDVRYGSTTEMATTILEEGTNSPADVFFAQDTGGLGAVQLAGLFAPLDSSIVDLVDPRWQSDDGGWIGVSGRARVLVYNPELIQPEDLPASLLDLTDPQWSGRFGWAPTNASLQAFVTGMRLLEGEEVARSWLEGVLANDAQTYGNNGAVLEAVGSGEVEFGLVNHYYLHARLADEPNFSAANHYGAPGDIGAMVGVAGVGILATSDNKPAAEAFVKYLLSVEGQTYFSETTYEYPVIAAVSPNADLPSLDEIQPPAIDLDELADLEGTLELMREVGALE